MEIKRVEKNDQAVLEDLLENHIDSSDHLDERPTFETLERLLEDDRSYLLVVLINDKVVGYTLAYRFPSLYASGDMAYLYDIDVVPEHRQKGVGRLLIETVKACLFRDGVTEAWLGTAVDNWAAQRLFAATGGIKSGEKFYDYTYVLSKDKSE
ncbi:GNAT family N-acetyltransferase [Runella sp.]|uniref:GNAT family N-acetyltransferase n=1 Tax=Runella sp. TaxID=1960881 RepID=UPI003D10C85D